MVYAQKKCLIICVSVQFFEIMCIYCRISSYCIMTSYHCTVHMLINAVSMFVQLHLLPNVRALIRKHFGASQRFVCTLAA